MSYYYLVLIVVVATLPVGQQLLLLVGSCGQHNKKKYKEKLMSVLNILF